MEERAAAKEKEEADRYNKRRMSKKEKEQKPTKVEFNQIEF